MVQRFRFLAGIALAASLSSALALAEGQKSAVAGIEACPTNSDVPGDIFRARFNTLKAPWGGETVEFTASNGVTYLNDPTSIADVNLLTYARHEDQTLVFTGPRANTGERTIVEFRDRSGRVLETCFITVVEFDASIHNAAATRVGNCDFGKGNGVTRLAVGASETVELPHAHLEGAVSPPSVLAYRPEGARTLTFSGKSAGFATFIWRGADTGSGTLMGVCPFIVSEDD